MSSRHTSPVLLFLLVALLSTVPRSARSELVHGFLTMHPDYVYNGYSGFYEICGEAIDFSTQTIVRHDSAGANLCFREFLHHDSWYFKPLAAGLRRMDASLEDVLVAPGAGYRRSGVGLGPIGLNYVYAILTDDGFYAKFRIHKLSNGHPPTGPCCSLTIEYYVQLDGSRNLDQRVPVHSTTWGRVKALYAE